jgi:CD36 family
MYDFRGDYETFFTGETDPRMSGLYDTFRGSTDLPQWKEKHCSNIQSASDGTKFKSFIKSNETLLFFRKSMCRPQRLVSSTSLIACTSYLGLVQRTCCGPLVPRQLSSLDENRIQTRIFFCF